MENNRTMAMVENMKASLINRLGIEPTECRHLGLGIVVLSVENAQVDTVKDFMVNNYCESLVLKHIANFGETKTLFFQA